MITLKDKASLNGIWIARAAIQASLFLLGTHAAIAGNLYNQASDFNGAYASQNDHTGFGNYATLYDNFTLGQTSDITGVDWIGSYFNGSPVSISNPGLISGFTVQFYSDAAGVPGSSVFTEFVPGNAQETYIGSDLVDDPTYTYSTNLSSTFTAIAGTQYWMSIVPDANVFPQWGWEYSTEGDGASLQMLFGSPNPLAVDEAFGLSGSSAVTATPEPSSVAAMAFGSFGLLFMGLRLRKRRADVA